MNIRGKKPRGAGSRPTVTGHGNGPQGKKADEEKVQASESVDISSREKELNKAKKLLYVVPDIRGEMVVRLKADIESGNYYIDIGRVAEKMMEMAVSDAFDSKKRF